MAVIGVTGLPASGKSFVCEYLSTLKDFFVIDADKIGHEFLKKQEVLNFIEENYSGVIENGEVVRPKLAELIFKNYASYSLYNDFISSLMKPYILGLAEEKQKEFKHVVLDGALIFEWEIESCFDVIVFCEANEKDRLKMLKLRGSDLKDYKKREAMLLDEYIKLDQSDIIIKNSYDSSFAKEIKQLQRKIEELA